MTTKTPKPPSHLSAESQAWFAVVAGEYKLESHHVKLLQAAAECWDRSQQAREAVAKDGLTYLDRHNNIRPHPGCQIERDNRTLFARLLRELGLDLESPQESRPPIIHANPRVRA